MEERRICDEGLELIKRWEGLRLEAYQDSAGVWTIGYGHTGGIFGNTVSEGMKITEAQAEDFLRNDLDIIERAVCVAVSVELTDYQYAALVSFCFNVGISAFRKSTLLKKLNNGEYDCIPEQLQRWNKVKGKRLQGLANRRAAECGLWARGSYVCSHSQEVQSRNGSWALKFEMLSPIVASCSGVCGVFAGDGPVQYVLAGAIMVAAVIGFIFIVKRLKDNKL